MKNKTQKRIEELEEIERNLNGLFYEIYEALINQPEIQKKLQKYADLSHKIEKQTLQKRKEEEKEVIDNGKFHGEVRWRSIKKELKKDLGLK